MTEAAPARERLVQGRSRSRCVDDDMRVRS
ncbi:unnamed protein product, partial [Didymodactylos carnosus]